MPRGSLRKLYKRVLREIADSTATINKRDPLVWTRTLVLFFDHEEPVLPEPCKLRASTKVGRGKQRMEEEAALPRVCKPRRSCRGRHSREKGRESRRGSREQARIAQLKKQRRRGLISAGIFGTSIQRRARESRGTVGVNLVPPAAEPLYVARPQTETRRSVVPEGRYGISLQELSESFPGMDTGTVADREVELRFSCGICGRQRRIYPVVECSVACAGCGRINRVEKVGDDWEVTVRP